MKIILFFSRLILSIRYRVKINGIENLNHNGPLLVLPNHEALVDPRIIMSFLGKYKILSPVASEKYYNLPGLNQVMKMAGTVPIGEMAAGASIDEVKKVFSKIVDGLKEGKNILIYPSGQIYRQNFESIKGKQSTYYIVNNMPANTKVLLLRQRGLWGSIRSKAWDNGKTTFSKAYIKGILYTFANLIFFVPKRNVNIEIFDYTDEINKIKTNNLNEFNQFLEDFYNKEPAEELRFIKHYFYYNDVKDRKEPDIIDGSLKELSKTNIYDLKEIPLELKNKIIEKVSLIKSIEKSIVKDDSKLVLDLFFDSLDTAEIKSYVQANFPGASNPPITDLKTIADLYVMAVGKSASEEKLKDCDWGNVNTNHKLLLEIVNISMKQKITNIFITITFLILVLFFIFGRKANDCSVIPVDSCYKYSNCYLMTRMCGCKLKEKIHNPISGRLMEYDPSADCGCDYCTNSSVIDHYWQLIIHFFVKLF